MSGYMDFEVGNLTGQPDNLNALNNLSDRNKNLLNLADRMIADGPDETVDWQGVIEGFHPEKRCVDCRWAKSSVKVNVYDHGSSIIFGHCEHPEIEGCEWSINYNKKTPIISFLRQNCTFILPDGSYGFEPAEVEE